MKKRKKQKFKTEFEDEASFEEKVVICNCTSCKYGNNPIDAKCTKCLIAWGLPNYKPIKKKIGSERATKLEGDDNGKT